jgi:hypothetical protein
MASDACGRLPERPAEPLPAASVVGAVSRTRSGAERRTRTTARHRVPIAPNGTSGVFAESKHAGREATWATPWTGDGGQ